LGVKIHAMRIHLLAAAAFAAALAMPLGVYAQQGQAPSGYGHVTPSQAQIQHRWGKRLSNLNLSSDQQQRIQSIINQYSQAHPAGSPRDPDAAREFRRQVMGVLTPDQQNQYHQQMRAWRAQMRQGAGQMPYQQGAPGQQYQQGPPDQQYQQGPPDQQYQQGPPDQQYQQGPPDQQYQQGPPPDQQQGPPPSYAQPPA
jgi:Spy/CpxP family protein refolding chaperone